MSIDNGILLISLDYESFWGLKDTIPLEKYKLNLLGERKVIPKLLDLFKNYGIHATWAAVGFLFFKNKIELQSNIPHVTPHYINPKINPYLSLHDIGDNEEVDPFHYGWSLIELIKSTPYQEIATHTFSHFYSMEDGQNSSDFEEDLKSAIKIAWKNNIDIKSIVFPRNQINLKYLSICKKYGIIAFRGNEKSWLYAGRNEQGTNIIIRLLRYLDCYFNLSGQNTYAISQCGKVSPFDFASSKFLYWYNKRLRFLEPFRFIRIKNIIRSAAKSKKIVHLWWHPHNFGINVEQNLKFLENLLRFFLEMKKAYQMKSLTMGELAATLSGQRK